jgi:Flp pilus assembly protein CpaB
VVGGLLVTIAMVGTFGAYTRAGDAPADRVLVVRHDLAVGEPLASGDVGEAAADLPPSTRDAAVEATADLAGAVTLAPLRTGDILQRSAVRLDDDGDATAPSGRQLSLPVERDRALSGDLSRGESVDVLATYGTGESAYTATVARRARIVDVHETTGGLGSDGRIVVVLTLDDEEVVLRVAHAAVAATVTLVRATGAPDGDVADRYPTIEPEPGRR